MALSEVTDFDLLTREQLERRRICTLMNRQPTVKAPQTLSSDRSWNPRNTPAVDTVGILSKIKS